MKKLLFCLIIIILFFNFYYIKDYQILIKETTYLWFTILLPSVMPMYVFSNLLLSVPSGFKIFYHLLNPIYRFESLTSTTIFILSFLTSNPTTSMIITNSYKNGMLSLLEANRLMRSTSHFSFTFIYLMTGKYFLIVFLSLFLASSIIYRVSYSKETQSTNLNVHYKVDYSKIINDIIDNGYQILLKILYTMLIIGLITNFITHLLPFKFVNIISSFFEIVTGINFLKETIVNPFFKYLLITILLSFSGLAIILQTQNVIRNTLSTKNFLKFRLVHMLLSSLFFTLFYTI